MAGALNGAIFVGPRVYYAMSRDGVTRLQTVGMLNLSMTKDIKTGSFGVKRGGTGKKRIISGCQTFGMIEI